MKIHSVGKKIKEEGLPVAVLYYICRICTKAEAAIVGRWVQRFAAISDHRIVFKNRQMQDFTDNARALFEYLVDNKYNEEYQIIYMVSNKKNFKKKHFRNVKFVTAENRFGWTSPRAFYYGNTAKYFFYTNNTAGLNRHRCPEQVVINLWHGCGYKGAVRKDKNIPPSKSMEMFDYALVPGPIFVETKSAYWECGAEKILPFGYPRYDWLLDPGNKKEDILHRLFSDVENVDKVIIWMPTFRKSILTGYGENEIEFACDLPAITSRQQLQELDQLCAANKILLIIKKHPLQIGWSEAHNYQMIRYVTDRQLEEAQVQLYRLVSVCDGLLTDYSSIAIDYLLMDRPLGFVISDLELYQEKRGFVFEDPLAYMPGEKIYDFQGIKQFIGNIVTGTDLFQKERSVLIEQMHNKTENYSARIIEFLKITKQEDL